MTRPIALMDWDNTLRPGFTILDWSSYLASKHLFNKRYLRDLFDAISDYGAGKVSYLELSERAPELYALGLHGSNVAAVAGCASEFVENDRHSLFSFTSGLHEFLRRQQIEAIVISGAPIEVLHAYQKRFGWSAIFGVRVEVADGIYSASLTSNPAGAVAKETIVHQLGSDRKVLLAIGDSESDVPLLDAAQYKIVVDSDGVIADSTDVLRIKSDVSEAELLKHVTAAVIHRGAQ